jgi:2-keto-4-pentenoate hydratase/2-oxohepta-3-ene-1,7-dioic acid hydratase in catechol pathway
MRLVSFLQGNQKRWGVAQGQKATLLKDAPFGGISPTSIEKNLSGLKILVPCQPTKIVLVGLNYRNHAHELNMKIPKEPIIFLKPLSSLLNPQEKIIYPRQTKQLDYEGELALVVKKRAKNISYKPEVIKDYILGYTCLNDLTARDLQKKDGQWTRAKSFDCFCPVGPWLETDFDPLNAEIKTFVNGELKQNSNTINFIFDPYYVFSFISKIMTLEPGDVIATGTPPGVGPLASGDKVEISIKGIGILANTVQ